MSVNTAVRAVVRSPGKAAPRGVVLAGRYVHFSVFCYIRRSFFVSILVALGVFNQACRGQNSICAAQGF